MIELRYPIEARDWARHLPRTLKAIERWAEPQGVMLVDEFGPYYDLTIHGNAKADMKTHRVLRPSTLHLGANKLLQEPHEYGHGFQSNTFELFVAVTLPKPRFLQQGMQLSTLDLLVQVALFRGEVLFP